MSQRSFRVYYHREGESFWAESPDAPGFTAAAETLDELEHQIADGLRFWLAVDYVDLVLLVEHPPAVQAGTNLLTVGADIVDHHSQTGTHTTSALEDLEVVKVSA